MIRLENGRVSWGWILPILSIFLLAGTAVTLLSSDWISDRLRARLEPEIRQALGEPVSIGRYALSLLPAYLELRDVVVGGEGETHKLLAARELRAYISLWSLLGKTVEIPEIRIDGASLRLSGDNEGIPRLHKTFDRLTAKGPSDGAPARSVHVGSIQFSHASFFVSPRDRSWEIENKDLSIAVNMGSLLRDIEAQVHAANIVWKAGERSGLIEKLNADLVFRKEQWIVRELMVETSRSRIKLAGDIGSASPYSIQLALSIDAAIGEIVPLEGEDEVDGRLLVTMDVGGSADDPSGSGKLEIRDVRFREEVIGRLTGAVRISRDKLWVSNLDGGVLGGRLSGEVSLSGEYSSPGYEVMASLADVDLGRALKIAGLPIRIDGMYVSGRLESRGSSLTLPDTGTVDLTAARSKKGASTQKDMGHLEKALTLIERAKIHSDWSGSGWVIRGAGAQGGGAVLTAKGEVTGSGNLRIDISGQAADVGLWTRTSGFPVGGRSARLKGEITGTVEHPEFRGDAALSDLTVQGILLGDASTDLLFHDGALSFRRAELRDGDGRYNFTGTIGFKDRHSGRIEAKRPMLEFQLDASGARLGKVIALFEDGVDISADTSGRLSFRGEPEKFVAEGDFRVTKGNIYGQTFEQGSVQATFDEEKIDFTKITLREGKSVVDGKGRIGYDGTYSIDAKGQNIHIEDVTYVRQGAAGLSGTGTLSVTGSGLFDDPGLDLHVALDRLTYRDIRYQGMRAEISIHDHRSQIRAKTDDETIEAVSSIGMILPYPVDGRLALRGARIDPLVKWFLPELSEKILFLSTGSVDLSGSLNRPGEMNGIVRFTRLGLSYEGYDLQNDGDVELILNQGKVTIGSLSLTGPGTSLNLNGNVQLARDFNLFLSGEAELGLFRLITPEIGYGKGRAYLALKISDEWKNPNIRGGITVQDGAVRSETLSQTFNIQNMGLFFNERQVLLESLEGGFGTGKLSASGKMNFDGFSVKDFGFILEVSQGRFRLPIGFSCDVDGTVIYQGTPDDQVIKGEVTVRRGLYNERVEWKNWIAELQNKEVTRVEEPVPVVGQARLNIHLVGKEDLRIDNNLAKVPFAVDVFLRGTVDRPILVGRVEADEGLAYFNRNDLHVQSATVDFVDPRRIKPVFDLHAKTRVRTYQIDLIVQGTADKFDLILTSDPSLPREDILALLIFGKTTTEITPEQQQQVGVQGTAGFISGPIQDIVEEKVEQVTGIDRFQVDPYYTGTRGSGGPRLTITKRLFEDKLTVTYATTIEATQEQVIQLEYALTDRVSLIGERDESGRFGGDLKFHFNFR